jgi:glycogen synthase
MKLAMVTREFPPHAGGIGSYTEKTARTLAAAGHEVHVVTEAVACSPGDEIEGRLQIHRLPPSRLRPREVRSLHRAVAVARALRRLGPFDVVQACEWEGEASVFALRPTAPLITRIATPRYLVDSLNATPARERRRHAVVSAMERWQTRHSTRVIAPSRAMAEEVARAWRLDAGAITIVPTGIRPPAFDATGIPDRLRGTRFVLFFGRLEVRKGVDVWLDALPQVLAMHGDITAVFAGRDAGLGGRPFVDVAGERAAAIWDRLLFLPHLPHAQLFPLIAASTLVVLPSRWENLANACLEAMVLGRVVVATTGSAFAEMIEDGVHGFLVAPGEAAALGRVVATALDDPERLAAMGAAARGRAADFDLDRMVARLLDVYREVRGEVQVSQPRAVTQP